MSVFSTERPVSADELRAMQEQKAAEMKANKQLMEAQRLLEEKEMQLQEEMARLEAEERAKTEKEQAMEALKQKQQMEAANREYNRALTMLVVEGRQFLTKHVLYKIIEEGLWIDDQVKNSEEFVSETMGLFETMIENCDEATGTNLVSNMENTRLLSYINDVVTESSAVICDRILTEAKETKPLVIKFDPTPEEVEVVDKKISEADPKAISKVVKNKVLDIIKEERETGKVKADLFQELDEAAKEDNEEEDGGDVSESLVGLPMDKTLEAIDIKDESTPVYEHIVTKISTMVSLADKECIARNFDKAKACYEQVQVLENQLASLHGYQTDADKMVAISAMTEAINSRKFDIRPGTKKAVCFEKAAPAYVTESLANVGSSLTGYCKDMISAITNRNIVTETLEEAKNRMIRTTAAQTLHSSIGSTLFESLMIKNSILVKNSVMESGVSLLESEVQNAALLQTIVEYTMLETLNTMQVYKFSKDAISKLKKA